MTRNSPLSKRNLKQRYHYILLQRGTLPLGPDKSFDLAIEHRCSSVLIWPEGQHPTPDNTILTDPCLTVEGAKYAEKQLIEIGLSLIEIQYIFITHRHGDHRPNFLHKKNFIYFQGGKNDWLPRIDLVPCPGHTIDLQSLVFRSTSDENIWIVGDAILDLAWLKAWEYYWPNFYTPREVVQTWESVAKILSEADVIIPGHGDPIHVTASLVKELLSTFPSAEYAENCRNVERFLNSRLERLLAEESQNSAEESRKNQ